MVPRSLGLRRARARLRTRGALLLAIGAAITLFEAVLYLGHFWEHGTLSDVSSMVYDVIFLFAAGACLRRGWQAEEERSGWMLVGTGLLLSACGYVFDGIHWLVSNHYVFPSVADFLWTAMYPLLYVGFLRIAAARGGHRPGLLIDGAIGALALAALAAEIVVPRLETLAHGDPATVITNIVYPLADLHLFGFVLWTWLIARRRLGAMWPLAIGVLGMSVAVDAVYTVQTAAGTYGDGSLLDLGWPIAALGYALLPFLPKRRAEPRHSEDSTLNLAAPAIGTLVCAFVLIEAAATHAEYSSLSIASVGLLAAIVRGYRVTAMARRLQLEVAVRTDQLAEAQSLAQLGSSTYDTATGRWRWSDALWRLHGFEPGAFELTTPAIMGLTHPDDRERAGRYLAASAEGPDGDIAIGFRIVRADGQVRHMDLHGRKSGSVIHTSLQDITERRLTDERLRKSESRFRTIIETAHDGIWIVDRDRRTVFLNERMSAMLGLAPEQVLGRTPMDFSDAEGRLLLERMWQQATATGAGAQDELRFERPDGDPLWAMVSVSPTLAWDEGATMVVTDMTPRKMLEAELRRAAEFDDRTGLPNRATFERTITESIAEGRPFAIALIDLDHFKWVNDSFGHEAGDDMLRHSARVMAEHMRADDLLARFGGDEFTVLLRDVDADRALGAVERLLQGLRDEPWRGTRQSASAGLAAAAAQTTASPGDLLRAADIALYEAKDGGRDRCAIYRGRAGGMAWVDEVRSAIEHGELVLYSQPIFPLGDGTMREELLVRMVGRDGDLLPPSAFIPTAEQFGLIGDLDLWVAERALEMAAAGNPVEVNVSGASLGDHRIREAVVAAVALGVDASLLTFEITETSAVRNLDEARAFAEELTTLGCGFALDDFGTGYGSLTYLRHLPVTQIKIDQDFVRGLTVGGADERIVRGIVGLAATLGTETVAEGVEDPALVDLLREIGVDYAQGYGLARPAPARISQAKAPGSIIG